MEVNLHAKHKAVIPNQSGCVFFLCLHHVSFGFSSHFTIFKSNTAML